MDAKTLQQKKVIPSALKSGFSLCKISYLVFKVWILWEYHLGTTNPSAYNALFRKREQFYEFWGNWDRFKTGINLFYWCLARVSPERCHINLPAFKRHQIKRVSRYLKWEYWRNSASDYDKESERNPGNRDCLAYCFYSSLHIQRKDWTKKL